MEKKEFNKSNMCLKKIAATFMVLFILIISPMRAYAADSYRDAIGREALELARDFTGFRDIELDEKILLSEEQTVVEFKRNGEDYGFVLFEKKEGSHIPKEFVIDKEISYEKYITSISFSGSNSLVMHREIDKQLSKGPQATIEFKALSEDNVKRNTGKYACVPVALTEVAMQKGILINNNEYDTFNQLWNDTNTFASTTEIFDGKTITFGGTLNTDIASGMKKYAKRFKYGVIEDFVNYPTFNYFYNALSQNKPCILSYKTSLSLKEGHAVNVYGAFIRYSSSGERYNYLGIADGWTKSPKFIIYDQNDFVYALGVSFYFYKSYK